MKGKFLIGLVGGLVAVVASGIGSAGGAHADTTVTICASGDIGQQFSCEYSRPHGIESIFITQDTDAGIVVVWNEVYDCESPILVEYVNVGPGHHFEIEACPPPEGVGGDNGMPGSFSTLPQPPSVAGLKGGATGPGGTRQGPYSACYVNYTVCDLKSYECEHLGQGCPPPSSQPQVLELKSGAGGQGGTLKGPHSACYANYTVCDLKSYECEHLGQGCPPPSSSPSRPR